MSMRLLSLQDSLFDKLFSLKYEIHQAKAYLLKTDFTFKLLKRMELKNVI